MKIAIVPMFYPPTIGSGPILMEEFASFFAKRGHNITVITTQPEEGIYRNGLFNIERNDNHTVIRTRTYLSKKGQKRLLSWIHYSLNALLASLTNDTFDLVFLRSPPPTLAITGYILQGLKDIPFVFNVQDIHPDLAITSGILTNPYLINLAKRFEKWAYDKSDSIIVISEGFKKNLIKKGVLPEKIEIIPNWVDTDFIKPLPKDNPVGNRLNLNNSFIIMHAGTLTITSYNALIRLLDIVSDFKKDNIIFAFVGEGLCKNDLESKVEELNLSSVHFFPFQPQEELPYLWASADVSVVALDPDKSESSIPSKVYNIMATGRPILGLMNPESETASIINKAECGIVADPRKKEEVKDVIFRLKNDDGLRDRLGENGRKEALKKYSKDVVLKKYEEHFFKIAKST